MKKYLVVFLALCFAIVCAEDKKVEVKKEEVKKVEVVAPVLTQADWAKANDKAKALGDEGKFLESADAYLAVGEIAIKVKDGYEESRLGWSFNNAAYMIIKQHQKDRTGDLNKAKLYLEKGMDLDKVSEDCSRCLESNMGYVEFWLGTKRVVAPKAFTTPEIKKEVTPVKK